MKNLIEFLKQYGVQYKNYILMDRNKIQNNSANLESFFYETAQMNVQRIIPTCVALILVEIISFVMDLFWHYHSTLSSYFYLIEFLLILAGIIYIFWALTVLGEKKTSIKTFRCLYRSFWIIILLLGGISFALDGYSRKQFTFPMSLYLLIAILPLLSWKELYLFLIIPNAVWISAVFLQLKTIQCYIYNALAVSLFSAVVSFVLYQTFYNQLKTEKSLEKANRELELMSITDSLTGLLNRFGMDQIISNLWTLSSKEPMQISVIISDIDYFKEYNDTFGHYTGDTCLCQISSAFKNVFENNAEAIARIGGEEFVVILKNIKQSHLMKLIPQMQDAIAQLNLEAGNKTVSTNVTVSFGVVLPQPIASKSWSEFYIKADAALYEAKRNGRNKVISVY